MVLTIPHITVFHFNLNHALENWTPTDLGGERKKSCSLIGSRFLMGNFSLQGGLHLCRLAQPLQHLPSDLEMHRFCPRRSSLRWTQGNVSRFVLF